VELTRGAVAEPLAQLWMAAHVAGRAPDWAHGPRALSWGRGALTRFVQVGGVHGAGGVRGDTDCTAEADGA